MENQITSDSSASVLTELNDYYHSCHGAMAESRNIFIQAGLKEAFLRFGLKLNILEVGFGTGLNALLTYQEAGKHQMDIWYTDIELHPVSPDLINYPMYAKASGFPEHENVLQRMHELPFNVAGEITPTFVLEKRFIDIREFSDNPYRYHLVYYDAFAPEVQPEMWTKEIFYRIHATMAPKGILVTSSTEKLVQRSLKSAGFSVEIIDMLPGNRQMLRAIRN